MKTIVTSFVTTNRIAMNMLMEQFDENLPEDLKTIMSR